MTSLFPVQLAIFLPEDRHAAIGGGGDPSYNMAAVPS
jgi:hypothetical protein